LLARLHGILVRGTSDADQSCPNYQNHAALVLDGTCCQIITYNNEQDAFQWTASREAVHIRPRSRTKNGPILSGFYFAPIPHLSCIYPAPITHLSHSPAGFAEKAGVFRGNSGIAAAEKNLQSKDKSK
jgi:hypothetical protein